jgi:DNA mismatch repair protein MutS
MSSRKRSREDASGGGGPETPPPSETREDVSSHFAPYRYKPPNDKNTPSMIARRRRSLKDGSPPSTGSPLPSSFSAPPNDRKLNTDLYFEYQHEYEGFFGERTVVMMEKGGFFEIYGYRDEETGQGETVGKVYEIISMFNCLSAPVLGKNTKIHQKNPRMWGVPTRSLENWVGKLVRLRYTCVLLKQFDPPPGSSAGAKKTHRVVGVRSPAYNPDSSGNSTNIMSIFLAETHDSHGHCFLSGGIAVADVQTGHTVTFETRSDSVEDDPKMAMDELYRMVNAFSPKEVMLHMPSVKMVTDQQVLTFLELSDVKTHLGIYDKHRPSLLGTTSILDTLQKVFPPKVTGMVDPVTYVGLEKSPYALSAYVYLILMTYKHSEALVKQLSKPSIWNTNRHLVIASNAVKQLNVVPDRGNISNCGIDSLKTCLDHTVTAVGKRAFHNRLMSPTVDHVGLNAQYDRIEYLLKSVPPPQPSSPSPPTTPPSSPSPPTTPPSSPSPPTTPPSSPSPPPNKYLYTVIQEDLRGILDIERLQRSISINSISPASLVGLLDVYERLFQMWRLLKGSATTPQDVATVDAWVPSDESKQRMDAHIRNIRSVIDVDLANNEKNIRDIENSFFKCGVFPEIDSIQDAINEEMKPIASVHKMMEGVIQDALDEKRAAKKSKTPESNVIKIGPEVTLDTKTVEDKTEKRKETIYEFRMTKTNLDIIKKSGKFDFSKGPDSFTWNDKCNKICSPELELRSKQIQEARNKLVPLCTAKYFLFLDHLYGTHIRCMNEWAYFLGDLDRSASCAKTAKVFGYCKPRAHPPHGKSWINAKGLRHPVIERIRQDVPYVPNDVHLGCADGHGKQVDGMLLYGVNVVGKSSYMKAIGLSVIMAQAGMWVPASCYEFAPYQEIFTRIYALDNYFRGESTYSVEMNELRSIFKRASPQSLVIGDELCSGTEPISALALVTAGVKTLSDQGVSFVFATHLHDLADMDEVSQAANVHNFHMETTITFRGSKSVLDYTRKLKPGSGPSEYGLYVAEACAMDDTFMEIAHKIHRRIRNVPDMMVSSKRSGYNKKVVMDMCQVCGKNKATETDHIQEQRGADKDGMIGKMNKNTQHNLVSICGDCHKAKTYDNRDYALDIRGWKYTSQGRVLDFVVTRGSLPS